jgi:hypothetical protein
MKKWTELVLSLLIFYLAAVLAGFIAHKCGYHLSESIWVSPGLIGGLAGSAIAGIIGILIKKNTVNK